MSEITLAEAKSLYTSTGFCKHVFVEDVVPHNCGIKLINCVVCAEEMDREFIAK